MKVIHPGSVEASEDARSMARPEQRLFAARALDENGRCCDRKPVAYRRPTRSFCPRCNRQYAPDGTQESNWAWKAQFNDRANFIPTYPTQAYTLSGSTHKGDHTGLDDTSGRPSK